MFSGKYYDYSLMRKECTFYQVCNYVFISSVIRDFKISITLENFKIKYAICSFNSQCWISNPLMQGNSYNLKPCFTVAYTSV